MPIIGNWKQLDPSLSVLDDLVAWHPGFVPYVQGVPMRIRALLLDKVDDDDSFWSALKA